MTQFHSLMSIVKTFGWLTHRLFPRIQVPIQGQAENLAMAEIVVLVQVRALAQVLVVVLEQAKAATSRTLKPRLIRK